MGTTGKELRFRFNLSQLNSTQLNLSYHPLNTIGLS